MLHNKFQVHQPSVLKKKIFEGFLLYMGLTTMVSQLCDQDPVNKLLVPQPRLASHGI